MKMQVIKNVISTTAGRSGLLIKKHSPELLMIGGSVGVVTSIVLACRATLKVDSVMEEAKQNVEKIHHAKETLPEEKYSEKDYKRDLTITHGKKWLGIAKLYAPAATLALGSLGCFLMAHGIMKKRNLALIAAYKAVEQSFSDYRKRVKDELGEDADRHFRYRTSKLDVTEMAYTDEDGVKHEAQTSVYDVIDDTGISMYAKVFDEYNDRWSPTPEYNMHFLITQQNHCNDLLKSRGHVFLNEVYDALGFKRSEAGQMVGWVLDSKDGDKIIDFGIHETKIADYRSDRHCDTVGEERVDFINGYRPAILLDFNVDGVVHNLI